MAFRTTAVFAHAIRAIFLPVTATAIAAPLVARGRSICLHINPFVAIPHCSVSLQNITRRYCM